MTQCNLGREWFIFLTLPYNCSSQKSVRSGSKIGQQLEGRSWCGGLMLTGLLSKHFSPYFLMKLRTTTPGVEPLKMGWTHLHQTLISKMPYRFAHSLISLTFFSIEVPPLRWLYLASSWPLKIGSLTVLKSQENLRVMVEAENHTKEWGIVTRDHQHSISQRR